MSLMQAAIDIIQRSEEAQSVLHPTRLELLEQFREPTTAAEVARTLDLPRQRIGYHVRELRKHGLLEVVGERRKGNFVEVMLQSSARAYVIGPDAVGPVALRSEAVRDRFSSEYLAALSARTLRDLGELRRAADRKGKRLATLSLETEIRFRSPAEQAAFADELRACLQRLVERYHDGEAERGRSFRFVLAGYPTPDGRSSAANTGDSAKRVAPDDE
jgi:DNA-binding transcriptional ArsR family regulator